MGRILLSFVAGVIATSLTYALFDSPPADTERPDAPDDTVLTCPAAIESPAFSNRDTPEPVIETTLIEDQCEATPVETPVAGSSIPALPGLAGFEFRQMPRPVHPAEELAAELEDPAWAANMESRILAGVSEATDEPMTQIEVECRMTWCGIVVAMPDGGDRGVRRVIGEHIRESLGFDRLSTHGVGGPDREWAAIYLKADR